MVKMDQFVDDNIEKLHKFYDEIIVFFEIYFFYYYFIEFRYR